MTLKITDNFSEIIRSSGRDLNLVRLGSENEAGLLTSQPERFAQKCILATAT
jgi:hypothetical protein